MPLAVATSCHWITPLPPLHQGEEAKLPQPLLVGHVLWVLDCPSSPPLDPLQLFNIPLPLEDSRPVNSLASKEWRWTVTLLSLLLGFLLKESHMQFVLLTMIAQHIGLVFDLVSAANFRSLHQEIKKNKRHILRWCLSWRSSRMSTATWIEGLSHKVMFSCPYAICNKHNIELIEKTAVQRGVFWKHGEMGEEEY